jgi:hypothetical protein
MVSFVIVLIITFFRLNLSRCDPKKISMKVCNKSFRFCHKNTHEKLFSCLLFNQTSCVYQTLSKTCALSSPPNTHKTRFHQLGNMQWRNVFQLVAMHRFATKWSIHSFFFSYARAWSFSWCWRCLETKQSLGKFKGNQVGPILWRGWRRFSWLCRSQSTTRALHCQLLLRPLFCARRM